MASVETPSKNLKKEMIQSFPNFPPNDQESGTLPDSFESSTTLITKPDKDNTKKGKNTSQYP